MGKPKRQIWTVVLVAWLCEVSLDCIFKWVNFIANKLYSKHCHKMKMDIRKDGQLDKVSGCIFPLEWEKVDAVNDKHTLCPGWFGFLKVVCLFCQLFTS